MFTLAPLTPAVEKLKSFDSIISMRTKSNYRLNTDRRTAFAVGGGIEASGWGGTTRALIGQNRVVTVNP